MLTERVLVLNQNYEPMSVCSARKAIILLYLGKAEMVEKDHSWIHSVNGRMPLPSIVRLIRLVNSPRRRIMLNRKNIMRRDGFQCQYCGTKVAEFTLDHVIPRNRGGKDTWENLVCACMACNCKKGNRTPCEAHMPLSREPRKPGYLFFVRAMAGNPDDKWKPYLFMN
jgi:5-methylcytosine-specific restriction endonuclease McrA